MTYPHEYPLPNPCETAVINANYLPCNFSTCVKIMIPTGVINDRVIISRLITSTSNTLLQT